MALSAIDADTGTCVLIAGVASATSNALASSDDQFIFILDLVLLQADAHQRWLFP